MLTPAIRASRMTPRVARRLNDLGIAIVCIDARQAHQRLKAVKANKTDPDDAAGLAQLVRWRCSAKKRRDG